MKNNFHPLTLRSNMWHRNSYFPTILGKYEVKAEAKEGLFLYFSIINIWANLRKYLDFYF